MLTPAVLQAIDEIKQAFPASTVEVKEDGTGGAYVRVEPVDLGPAFTEETRRTWIGFAIGFQYPFADVYPHFARVDVQRADGQPLGPGLSGPTRFVGWDCDGVQVSRRSPRRIAELETAALKLAKVLTWMQQAVAA